MKKLLLILLIPMIGFGQFQYKLDSITFNYTDPVTQNLTSTLTHTFYYDAQGRCNTSFRYAGGGGILAKNDNTYDINNNLIDTYESVFDSTTLSWDTVGHYISTYDMSNNIVEEVYKYWNGNQWGNNSKKLFYYNSNNERTHKENFDWDSFYNQWSLTSCDEYTYQAGKPIIEIEQIAWQTNSCADTSGMIEWSYLGNNLSHQDRFNYSNTTNTFTLSDGIDFFCNSISLTNTAIPTYRKAFFWHSLGLFENQIDSAFDSAYQGTFKYHYSAFTSTSIQEHTTNKELLKTIDLLGRETKGKTNEPLFYIYDDGSVEKRITID